MECAWYEGEDDFPCTGAGARGVQYCIPSASSRNSGGTPENNGGATVLSVSVISTEGTETEIEVGSGGKPVDGEESGGEAIDVGGQSGTAAETSGGPVVSSAETDVVLDSSSQSTSLLVAALAASAGLFHGIM